MGDNDVKKSMRWRGSLLSALDEIERLREQMVGWMNRYEQMTDMVREQRAALDRVLALCDAADQRGRSSMPPNMTLSGCEPLHALISPSAVRAAVAGSPQNGEPR